MPRNHYINATFLNKNPLKKLHGKCVNHITDTCYFYNCEILVASGVVFVNYQLFRKLSLTMLHHCVM